MDPEFTKQIIKNLSKSHSKYDITASIANINDRINWDIGSLCLVYSRKQRNWNEGMINNIYIDSNDNKEWIKVKYSTKSKTIQRFCRDIQPIENHTYKPKLVEYIFTKWVNKDIYEQINRGHQILKGIPNHLPSNYLIVAFIRPVGRYIVDVITQMIEYYYGQYCHKLIDFDRVVVELKFNEEHHMVLNKYINVAIGELVCKKYMFYNTFIPPFSESYLSYPLIWLEYQGADLHGKGMFCITEYGLHHITLQQNDDNDSKSLSISKVLDTFGFDKAMCNFSAYQEEFRYL